MAEPALSLASSDFALFGLPEQFHQDRSAIDARWKELQREVHPDRFAARGPAAQREALQWSVRINEAYQRLKDPLRRAAYLCELRGAPVRADSNTAMPPAFLVQQMQWREALDEAADAPAFERLQAEVEALRREILADCARALDTDADLARAVGQVRALMFVERFADDVDQRRERLGTATPS